MPAAPANSLAVYGERADRFVGPRRAPVSKGATDGRMVVWDLAASLDRGAAVVLGQLAYMDTDIFFVKGAVHRIQGMTPATAPHGDVG